MPPKFSLIAMVVVAPVISIASTTFRSAEAASLGYTFDLSGSYNKYNIYDLSKPGLDLSVTSNIGKVVRTGLGLGVSTKNENNSIFANQLDGLGRDESLDFSFSRSVQLSSALFTFVNYNDEATVSVDGDELFNQNLKGNLFTGFTSSVNFAPNGGQLFSFGVTDKNDSYFLKKITVTHYEDGTEIPEPLTIFGTLAAVGAGAALKRKHSQSEKA